VSTAVTQKSARQTFAAVIRNASDLRYEAQDDEMRWQSAEVRRQHFQLLDSYLHCIVEQVDLLLFRAASCDSSTCGRVQLIP